MHLNLTVQKVVPSSENPQKLEVVCVYESGKKRRWCQFIVFSDKATNAGQTVGVDVQFDNARFYVVNKSVTEQKTKKYIGYFSRFSWDAAKTVHCHLKDLVLSDEFAQGTVEKVEQNKKNITLITLSFSPEVFAEMDEYKGGTITTFPV